jgi:membrane-associated phospholipid phosphatase
VDPHSAARHRGVLLAPRDPAPPHGARGVRARDGRRHQHLCAGARSLRPARGARLSINRTKTGALWALAIVCVGALAITYLLFVRTYHGQKLDQGAFDGHALANGHARSAADHLLTTISVASLAFALVVLMAQAAVRKRVALSLVAAAVIVGAVVTTEILKHWVLSRPDLVATTLFRNTFPSGHATVAFSVGVAATLVVPPRLRRWTAALAVLYAGGIGVAVIAAGWHRPSDVVGAFLVTMTWGAGVVAFAAGRDERAYLRTEQSWPDGTLALRYLLAGIALAALGFLAAVAVAFASETGRIGWTIVDAAFLGASAGVVALAAILMAALLYALRLATVRDGVA